MSEKILLEKRSEIGIQFESQKNPPSKKEIPYKLAKLQAGSELKTGKAGLLDNSKKSIQELNLDTNISGLEDLLVFFESNNQDDSNHSQNTENQILQKIEKYEQIYKIMENILFKEGIGYMDGEKIIGLFDSIDSQLKDFLSRNPNIKPETRNQIESIINYGKFTTEKQRDFNNKYKVYNNSICDSIGLDPFFIEGHIKETSDFDPNKEIETGIGYMGLSENVFLKICNNGDKYKSLFIKVKNSSILDQIKDPESLLNINKLFILVEKGEFSKEWKDLINLMMNNRKNPYYNLLIGNISMSFIMEKRKSIENL